MALRNAKWESVTLGELCHIARGGSPRPIERFLTDEDDGISWVKIGDATAGDGKYISATKQKIRPEGQNMSRRVQPGDFLLTNSMSFGRPYIMQTDGCIHDGWLVLRDESGRLDPDYLYHFLGSELAYRQFDALAAGSTVRNLNTDLVKRVMVIVPPLPEQRRIVTILDQAVSHLADAANLLQRYKTATQELFAKQSADVLTGGDGWEDRALGDVCTLQRGFDLPVQDRKPGLAPLISSSGPITFQSKAPVRAPGVVTGRSGTIGKVFWVKEDFWPLNTTLFVKDFHGNDPRFVFRLLQNFDLARYAGGAGVPTLNRNAVHGERVLVPTSLIEQQSIAAKLDRLESERNLMLDLADQRLALLAELKQSLLARAFSGELTLETLAA